MTTRPVDQHLWGRKLKRWPYAEARALTMDIKLKPFEVWRSKDYLAQIFRDGNQVRVSINRTHQPNGQDWAEGISWDALQQIKNEIGRGDTWAVELYPADDEVVDDANMRHLWLLDAPPDFGWRRK